MVDAQKGRGLARPIHLLQHTPLTGFRGQLFLLALVSCAALALFSPHVPLVARAAAAGGQQTPGVPFRTDIDYVNVDVTVRDQQGRPVRDLRAEEFELYEDGRRQQVSTFSLVEIPVTTGLRRPAPSSPARVEPDVRSNQREAAGRVYVLMLDDLHVAPLRSSLVKSAAREFIERYLGPNDLAAVLHTSGRADVSQEFTSSRHLLLRAVDKFVGRKLRSSVLERLDAYNRHPDEQTGADMRMRRIADPLATLRADHARSMLGTLTGVGDLLARAPGARKAVVLFSEGLDYDLQMGAAQTSSGLTTFTNTDAPVLRQQLQELIRASARANVGIYAVDPRGLAGGGDDLIEVTSLPHNPHLGLTTTAFEDELRAARDSLRALSEQTGGFAAVESNDLGDAFERIVSDNSAYYLLGYRSTNPRQNGSFRKIEVRVTRPGVRVRARSGYTAGPPTSKKADSLLVTEAVEPSPALREALNNPLPLSAVPLRVFAAPFKAETDASVLVGVEVDARQFRFEQKDGSYVDTLDVAIVALDHQAKFEAGDRHTIALRLQPSTYEAVRTHGVRLLFRLSLPPGRWQLRAAAHEAGANLTGSISYDLEIPDFDKAPLAMSGLVVTTSRAAEMPTARPDAVLQEVLETPPTGQRSFASSETLTAHFEVYGGTRGGERRSVPVVTTVRDGAGRVRFRSAAEADPAGGESAGLVVRVPLAGLPPGPYTLMIHAGPQTEQGRAVSREIPFQVTAPEPR